MMSFNCLCFLAFIAVTTAFNCETDGKLKVHLITHTHDDVGWLKTVDEYYYGANNTIQHASVQYILDSVVLALEADRNKTFIYVEMAFFQRWWDQQDDAVRHRVRRLIKDKQLEFINGGWCMNDEAATHYNAIIDQMTLGLRFINDTFGEEARPRVAWHIDPFGHSAEQASLFSMMSFDGFFFGRIDHADKTHRMAEQRMEMVWRGSRNLEKNSQIFTGVLYNGYNPPPGFCFDQFCTDEPIQDDPRMFDVNVKERVDAFVVEACEQAKSFKTDHIPMTMGSDFQFENAAIWYKNLDKLIKYVNQDGRIDVFYSTPSRYLDALHAAGKTWEVKNDDFFPYSHCPHCYWTGYFTSRPTIKGYIRQSNNFLQACKQMEATTTLSNNASSLTLRKAMAVAQHHDAVTGTEKQHVTYDYEKRLAMGVEECQKLMGEALSKKYSPAVSTDTSDFAFCNLLNISVCPPTEKSNDSFAIIVYNPLARPNCEYVRFPVLTSKSVAVVGPQREAVKSQISTVSDATKKARYDRGKAEFEATFYACAPPVGFSTYFVIADEKKDIKPFPSQLIQAWDLKSTNTIIQNEFLSLEISQETGRLIKWTKKDGSLTKNIDQGFFWYEGSIGDNTSSQTSGAYIFRPTSKAPFEITTGNKATVKTVKGPLCEEFRQTFGSIVSQTIRVCDGDPNPEFQYTVGPIPVDDKIGKEIIMRFDTDIKSQGMFYTDANGREIKTRQRDYRETWQLEITEPVSENYYPINSRIYIKDDTTQLTLMTDRSHGGGSIQDGSIEVMLHRRLLKDDFLGVAEPLDEPGYDGKGLITRGSFKVLLTSPKEAARQHREVGEKLMMPFILSFTNSVETPKLWEFGNKAVYTALRRSLPANVHLLTLETAGPDTVLVRFEHFYAKDDDEKLSKPVSFSFTDLFKEFTVASYVEVNLSANQLLSEKKMLEWNTSDGLNVEDNLIKNQYLYGNDEITLKPMEIKSFLITIGKRR